MIDKKPSAVDFLMKYKLPSSSSTLQALNAQVEKEMIFRHLEGYKVYGVFFQVLSGKVFLKIVLQYRKFK